MTSVVVLAIVAVALLVFLAFQVLLRYSRPSAAAQTRQLIPIDLDALENLTDPEEEQFLKDNLLPSEFREVQRTRIRAAKAYFAALSENAGVLVAVGQAARYHSDPETAAAGLEIVQRALRLKVWCLLALLQLNSAIFFPARLSQSNGIANRYLVITYMATNLPRKATA